MARYSGNFSLPELEQIILVTTETNEAISHARIKSFSSEHPKDISAALASLAKNKFLKKNGSTRDSLYYLPNIKALDPFGLFKKMRRSLLSGWEKGWVKSWEKSWEKNAKQSSKL